MAAGDKGAKPNGPNTGPWFNWPLFQDDPWYSWSFSGMYAHPDSPMGGGGPGGFRPPGPIFASQSVLGSPHPDAPAARHALTPSLATPSIRGFIVAGGPLSQTTILAINAAAQTHLSNRIFIAYEGTVNIGGDLSWRANNPGNLRGAPTKIGTVPGLTGTFAVFATPDDGFAAQRALYLNTYGTQTVRAAINHLTPPTENDTAAYLAQLQAAGVDLDKTVASQIDTLMAAVKVNEGGHPGITIPRTP
jgi:hypothetical protein